MQISKEILNIKTENIIPNRFQPRLSFDEESLNELAESIKIHGIIQPLILRQVGDKYEIIAGERRYKAATMIGLQEIPAIIAITDDQTSAELAIIENIQRKELSAIEEAISYKKLLDLGQVTQEQLATRMGKTQSTIANKLRLLNLIPEVQEALFKNTISERHARSLLQITDNNKQLEVLNKIINERMTVKDTDEYIKSLLYPENPVSEIPAPIIMPTNTFQNNDDIINLNALNNIESEIVPPLINNNIQSALMDLNITDINSNVFNDIEPIIEEKTEELPVQNVQSQVIENKEQPRFFPPFGNQTLTKPVEATMPNHQPMPTNYPLPEVEIIDIPTNQEPQVEKIKLNTPINMVRNIISNIESNGYIVKTEELDLDNEYQIIIKIEK